VDWVWRRCLAVGRICCFGAYGNDFGDTLRIPRLLGVRPGLFISTSIFETSQLLSCVSGLAWCWWHCRNQKTHYRNGYLVGDFGAFCVVAGIGRGAVFSITSAIDWCLFVWWILLAINQTERVLGFYAGGFAVIALLVLFWKHTFGDDSERRAG